MAVTTDLVFFEGATGGSYSDCDAITDWLPEPTLDTEIFIQGTGALSAKVSKATVTTMYTLSGPVNLSGKSLFCWSYILEIGILATKANKGFGLRVEDGAANWGEWNIAGKDTWGGQWKAFAQDVDTAFTSQSATAPDRTAITKVGVFFTTTELPKAYPNVFWDALRYGTYLRAYGGTEASPVDFDAILTAEDQVANKWGVLERSEGIIMAQGNLRFGSTTGEATYFKDISEVLVFKERPVGTVLYEMAVEGNATATTKVYFGEKSGDRGVSGCAFRSAGTSKFKFTAIDTNITDLGVYGCSFYDADTISFPPYSATREVLSCNFEACAEVLPNTCIVQYCNFISADDRALRFANLACGDYIKTNNFISCPKAVHINLAGTFLFDALMFSGNTYDIENSTAGGDVYIDRTNGSNPDPAKLLNSGSPPGTITINPLSVYLTIWVEDEDGVAVENAACYIEKASDQTELMNKLSDVNGKAQETFSYTVDTDINVRVRKSSPSTTRYIPYTTTGTITSDGYTLTVVLIKDLVAA